MDYVRYAVAAHGGSYCTFQYSFVHQNRPMSVMERFLTSRSDKDITTVTGAAAESRVGDWLGGS